MFLNTNAYSFGNKFGTEKSNIKVIFLNKSLDSMTKELLTIENVQ